MDNRTERQTEAQTHKLNFTPLGSSGTQCEDKCIATLESHTGNINSNSNNLYSLKTI